MKIKEVVFSGKEMEDYYKLLIELGYKPEDEMPDEKDVMVKMYNTIKDNVLSLQHFMKVHTHF